MATAQRTGHETLACQRNTRSRAALVMRSSAILEPGTRRVISRVAALLPPTMRICVARRLSVCLCLSATSHNLY